MNSSSFIHIFQNCFDYSSFFCISYKFLNPLVYIYRNILLRFCWGWAKYAHRFEGNYISAMVNLPIHESVTYLFRPLFPQHFFRFQHKDIMDMFYYVPTLVFHFWVGGATIDYIAFTSGLQFIAKVIVCWSCIL
jgi:hypothetical protein